MTKRWIAAIVSAYTIFNGVYMIGDGAGWYERIPGVVNTGPYNPHFVLDIGAAFLIAGLGLLARTWRARYWPAGVAGAGFLSAHAFIHLIDILTGHTHHAGVELVAVVIPSALALWAAFPAKGEAHV